jgi:hypothetical protein
MAYSLVPHRRKVDPRLAKVSKWLTPRGGRIAAQSRFSKAETQAMTPAQREARLQDVVIAARAARFEHRLALETVRQLRAPAQERWRTLVFARAGALLSGVDAPEHLLRDVAALRPDAAGGGADALIAAIETWHEALVDRLAGREWENACFAIGALARYVAALCDPLTTRFHDAAELVRRPTLNTLFVEFDSLCERLTAELGGWPDLVEPRTADWIARMCEAARAQAVRGFDAAVLRCQLDGARAVFDSDLARQRARLIGLAVALTARLVERAIAAAKTAPVKTNVAMSLAAEAGYAPYSWALRLKTLHGERALLAAQARERTRRGHLSVSLAAIDRLALARAEAEGREAEPVSLSFAPGLAFNTAVEGERPTPTERLRLRLADPIAAAPAISKTLAEKLTIIGIRTIADLVSARAEEASFRLGVRHVTTRTFADWQAMAELMLATPGMRALDAQLLILCGVRDAATLAQADGAALLEQIRALLRRPDTERALGDARAPQLEEAEAWIARARQIAA